MISKCNPHSKVYKVLVKKSGLSAACRCFSRKTVHKRQCGKYIYILNLLYNIRPINFYLIGCRKQGCKHISSKCENGYLIEKRFCFQFLQNKCIKLEKIHKKKIG